MRSSHATAVWMLELLGLDVALAGDLLEESQRGRSAVWYWRQVLIAAWIGTWRTIRDHKLLAVRAVATGFAMECLFIALWKSLGPDPPLFSMMSWAANLSAVLVTQMATGWVVARTHGAYQIPMVFVFLICFLPLNFGPHLFWVTRMLVDWNRIDPRYHAYVPWFVVTVSLTIVSVLMGGTLARPKKALSAADPEN